MTTPFSHTSTLRSAFFAALVAVFALGLAACTSETQETETAEPSAMESESGQDMNSDMAGAQVTVQETISALQGGITELPANMAVSNIEAWEQRLNEAGLSDIEANMADLREALQQQPIDGGRVGELLTELGNQTTEAAQNAQGETMSQLQQLGNTLTSAGEQLTGGGM